MTTLAKNQPLVIGKKLPPFNRVVTYYKLIFEANQLPITQKEVELVAHITLQGGIFTTGIRDSFIEQYSSSKAAVYNITSKLRKYSILIKQEKKIVINPQLLPDTQENPLILIFKLSELNEDHSG